jgi:ABC-2 type transport system ATP-binding protein
VLLVDEVLAVGDEQFQKKCLDKIREFQAQGRTIILVSHSLGQVQELCDTAVVMHHGEVKFQGSARLAVKNFREILEGRRIAEAEAAGFDHQEAVPGKVEGVTLEIPGRAPGAEVQPGDDVIIRATFSHATPLEHWHSGIKVENQFGHLVYGTDSRMLKLEHAPLHGRATVEYRLPNVQFGGGPYFVHAFFAKQNGEHIAIEREAARFVVADDDTQSGISRVAGVAREVTD